MALAQQLSLLLALVRIASSGAGGPTCDSSDKECVDRPEAGSPLSLLQLPRAARMDGEMDSGSRSKSEVSWTIPLAPGMERIDVLAEMSVLLYKPTPTNITNNSIVRYSVDIEGSLAEAAGYTVENKCHRAGIMESNNGSDPYFPTMCDFMRTDPSRGPRQVVISIQGTSLDGIGRIEDVSTNVQSFWCGKFPESFLMWMNNWVSWWRQMKYQVLVTGHSLGGYLAEVASSHLNLPGAAFNSYGVDRHGSWHSGKRFGLRPHPYFHVFLAEQDFVAGIQWPGVYHARDPIVMKGLRGHSPWRMKSWLLDVRGHDQMTIKTIYSYIWPGRKQGRKVYELYRTGSRNNPGVALPAEQGCLDSNDCLASKGYLFRGWTCENAVSQCSGIHSSVMMACCPMTCAKAVGDISRAPCMQGCFDVGETCLQQVATGVQSFWGTGSDIPWHEFENQHCRNKTFLLEYCTAPFDDAYFVMACCPLSCTELGFNTSWTGCSSSSGSTPTPPFFHEYCHINEYCHYDDVPEWRDSRGYSCADYYREKWCTPSGEPRHPFWKASWGTLSDYSSDDGYSAAEACCYCGGGPSGERRDPLPASAFWPGCIDSVEDWHDSEGYDCEAYGARWCTFAGKKGPSFPSRMSRTWRFEEFENFNHTALTACCACGGGKWDPTAPLVVESRKAGFRSHAVTSTAEDSSDETRVSAGVPGRASWRAWR